jgi:multicomponent Na+:H+ antiporter subunit E
MTIVEYVRRSVSIATWAFAVWVLLTWTATLEQFAFGGCLALAVGAALAPLGPVANAWRTLAPARVAEALVMVADSLWRIARANISLAARVWRPSRPLRSGMVVVTTSMRTDAGLAWTGLVSSLIVDNLLVDLDRESHELQYHAVSVPPGGPLRRADFINAPAERHLARVIGDHA